MASSGFGIPWGQTRTYSNQQKVDFDRGNGWNWNPANLPYLGNSTLAGASLTLYGNLYNLRYFYYDSFSSTWSPQFGDLSTFVHLGVEAKFRLTEPDGTVFLFHDMTHASRPGGLIEMSSPGGTVLAVTQESGDRIIELQRSVTTAGVTSTESFLYDYITSGDLDGHILTCTARRQINAGTWLNVSKVTYSYYLDGDASGSLADLRTATRQLWQSSAWVNTGTDYYRYYKEGAALGGVHNLKYVCEPEAFARLSASVADPFTASDAVVSLFADYYYEYDNSDRVILERVFAGSKTITYGYSRNPRYPSGTGSSSSSSAPPPGMNVWIYRTVETQPNNRQKIVYANYAGLTMLSVLKASASSTDQWCRFYRYDDGGRLIWVAHPSAITGYDDAFDDLLHYVAASGKYQYLRDNEGLIDVTEYYSASASSSSAISSSSSSGTPLAEPEGYVKAQKVQKGQLGTPITQQSWTYTVFTEGSTTIYPVFQQIQYPDETDPLRQIVTSYEYTYHSGTTQIEQRTTILPVVPTTQNGSGVANSRKEYIDILGYRTWSMDERGFITRFIYNTDKGALIQRTDDVQTALATGVPVGWTTPSGGGLNLITDYESDDQGRVTQELGPSHDIDLGGTATTIRRASWTVYDDANHATRSGNGYATGTGPSYTYTLINPVTIRQADLSNKPVANIQATRSSTSGKLLPTDTFAQSNYTRWTTLQYTDCCLLASQRVYHDIPATGHGLPGTNFNETLYGYDVMKRRNRVVTPGGTITFSVFDIRGMTIEVYVGTDDTGATASDPTAGGAFGNNMVLVTENQYDNGVSGRDGNLTLVQRWVDATTSRSTSSAYDWRDRRISVDGEIDYFAEVIYDNLGRQIRMDRRNTSAAGNLIGRQDTLYDDLGRVYQSIRYGVNPDTGVIGNSLTDNTWFDIGGSVAKTLPAGSNLWTKITYDSLGRSVQVYAGYGTDTTYDDIFTVTGDVILEQSETVYDDASNAIQATHWQRYHNAPASQTGALRSPLLNPKARVTYGVTYPDPLGRQRAVADCGTNGGAAFSRPDTIPASSDTVLVSGFFFGSAGDLNVTSDPAGMKTGFGYDDAGRRVQVSQATPPSTSSSSSAGTNCGASADSSITMLTYTPDGQVATLEAVNTSTGNQVTTYVYGTTLSDSAVAASVLLRSVIYPDSTGGSDQVWLGYNRQAQRTSLTDQNGSVHQYDYDLLGRLTQDRVPTLATGVDGAVRRIQTAYEVRGLVQTVSSLSSPTVGSGTTVNQVQFSYNDFAQSVRTYQSHSGAVNTSTTPSVQMGYADGSANTIQPLALTYPNGRTVSYDYGSSGSIDDQISRIASILGSPGPFGTPHLADYSYLGMGAVVQQDSPEANLRYTLIDSGSSDIYGGLDRFGRVQNLRWLNTSTSDILSQVKYGYDRASNRIWRENPTDPSRQYDWKYSYDGLHRLKDGQRGTLNSTHTGITSPQFGQCWTLDETGNWSGFKQSDDGTTWSLEQTRAANPVNELTAINASVGQQWATPVYDNNGNMTAIPRPESTQLNWANLTTDQWATLTADEWSRMPVSPTFTATYDAWNRLVRLVDPNASATGDLVQENSYDARGYRIITKTYTTGTLTETRHADFTDSWQIIEERLGTITTPDRQFVWGVRYIDDLILRDQPTTGGPLYALQDANWNTTAIADIAGAVQERYEYSPYGVTTILAPDFTVRTTSSFAWETTYCGYRLDQATGFQAVRNRYYHSQIGKWVSRDPIEYSVSTHLYSYCGNKPAAMIDSYGLEEGLLVSSGGLDLLLEETIQIPVDRNKGSLKIPFANAYSTFSHINPGAYSAECRGGGLFSEDRLYKKWKQGCVGVTSCFLGVDPRQDFGTGMGNCFKSFALAQQEQKRWNAAKRCQVGNCKNQNGMPPTARVFEFMFKVNKREQDSLTTPFSFDASGKLSWNDNNESPHTPLSRFDFHYYHDETDLWWGATDAQSVPRTSCTIMRTPQLTAYLGQPASDLIKWKADKAFPAELVAWLKVYCVICESDQLLGAL